MNVKEHYDQLIEENNDPFHDPPVLQEYMSAVKVAPYCSKLLGIDISPKTIKRARENLSHFDNLLNTGGTFCLSIDKNPNDYIDMGTRKLKIYPDK